MMLAVAPAVRTCSVCRQQRMHGTHDSSGEVFICDGCQADAKQFLAIQDVMWDQVPGTQEIEGGPSDDVQMPEHP